MGVMIKADEALRGSKRKVSKQSELMRSVLVHVVSGLVCLLVCCYSYWFPWFYCFINHFVWIYLPSVWPVVFGPKCMFVVANMIVVVVVGEWRQTCAKTRNIHDDMYDEYVRRSRGPRRVLVYKKVERKQDAAVRKICTKAIEIKKVETKEIVVDEEENMEDTAVEFHDSKEEIIVETRDNISEEKIEDKAEEKVSEEEENSIDDTSECVSLDLKHESAHDHEDVKNVKETISTDGGHQNGYAKKVEETKSVEDELNKRVEDFIARVNKRRWAEAEASNWLICSA